MGAIASPGLGSRRPGSGGRSSAGQNCGASESTVSGTVRHQRVETASGSAARGAGIAGYSEMRSVLAIAIALISSSPLAAQLIPADRTRVIEALERLLETGEPRHASHDEGEWLQGEVDRAFAVNDVEIMRLAQRAAAPVVARVSAPASATNEPLQLTIVTYTVLQLKTPVHPDVELWASVDGDDQVRLGALALDRGESFDTLLPVSATRAGLHHLRITARITFHGRSGLATEVRQLPDIVYARYDPGAKAGIDARLFISQAATVSARRLDASLPPVRFESWLSRIVTSRGGEFDRGQWRTAYCEDRILEAGGNPSGRAICAVAEFIAMGAKGSIWIRTGRLEGTGADVRWLAERPVFEGMRLREREFESLAPLPALVSTPPDEWPSGDVSVAPEEMAISVNRGTVHLSAIVRNKGSQALRGVAISVSIGTGTERGLTRQLVIDLAPFGSKTIDLELPLVDRYAAVVLLTLQGTEHAPFESWAPDPTPEDSVAFRVVNLPQAPRGYVEWVKKQCGPCRGF